jgi:hypothetical protein
MKSFPTTLATAFLASAAILTEAHPHKRSEQEIASIKHATRSLNQCTPSLGKRGHNAAGVERRLAMAERIRQERGLTKG